MLPTMALVASRSLLRLSRQQLVNVPALLQGSTSLQCRFLSDEGPRTKQTKVKKKKKKAPPDTSSERDLKLMLSALNAPYGVEPPISEEEKARRHEIGRNYVIGMINWNNDVDHDLTCKIKLRLHAVDMLPRNSKLKEKAFEDNDVMPPRDRHEADWFPPIPDLSTLDAKPRRRRR